jgi:hypothetical protein
MLITHCTAAENETHSVARPSPLSTPPSPPIVQKAHPPSECPTSTTFSPPSPSASRHAARLSVKKFSVASWPFAVKSGRPERPVPSQSTANRRREGARASMLLQFICLGFGCKASVGRLMGRVVVG